MLDTSILDQVRSIFAQLEANYTFEIKASASREEAPELTAFINDVASCSDKISCETVNAEGNCLEFSLLKNGKHTGIKFRGIPNGHEFTSLLLAVLNADGKGKNLPDEMITQRIKDLCGKVKLQTYVSLTCTNCPDIVQSLNIMSLLNDDITHEMIDGALFQQEADEMKIQAVPTVYANGKMLHVGRGSLGELLEKLEELVGTEHNESCNAINRQYDVIENLISVPHTTGAQLANSLRTHITDYPIDIFENRRIEKADLKGKEKHITAIGGEVFSAPAVIIATGAGWRKLNVEGENDYIGRGVAFCPHCDGPLYEGKHVAVIGGGNSGIEAAIDLAGICKKVTVFEFADTLRADKVLQEKAQSTPNVEIFTSSQTTSILGNGEKVTGIKVMDRNTQEIKDYPLDGIFVQIGLSANSTPFVNELETSRIGEILIDEHCRTSVPGVYAAGDVSSVPYKQIIIAMGEGAKAALSAFDDRIRGII